MLQETLCRNFVHDVSRKQKHEHKPKRLVPKSTLKSTAFGVLTCHPSIDSSAQMWRCLRSSICSRRAFKQSLASETKIFSLWCTQFLRSILSIIWDIFHMSILKTPFSFFLTFNLNLYYYSNFKRTPLLCLLAHSIRFFHQLRFFKNWFLWINLYDFEYIHEIINKHSFFLVQLLLFLLIS